MRIFLSYSRADTPIAEAIAATLKQAGHSVFFDQDRIQAAEDFNRVIWGQIQKSDLFVFLISPASIQAGTYALTELGFAEKKWPNPEWRVLPVVISPTEIAQIPVYASICHIFRPEGNVAAEVRAAVNRLNKRQRWVRIARAAAFAAGLAAIGVTGFWGYQEYLHQQPIKARETLAAMDIPFDEDNFVMHVYQGDLNTVELFLTAGMDPNAVSTTVRRSQNNDVITSPGMTALVAAMRGNQMAVVDRLIRAGADVNAKRGLALSWAARNGSEQFMRLLLSAGADEQAVNRAFEDLPEGDEKTKDRRLAIARMLLSQKVGVRQLTIDKTFVTAAASSELELLRLLSEKVSDGSRMASDALLMALAVHSEGNETTSVEIVKFLLAQGADLGSRDVEGWTPLLLAIREKGNEKLVRLLLEKGADPNVRCECRKWNAGGWTPLTLAIFNNDAAMIRYLLAHGADVNLARDNTHSSSSNTTSLILPSASRASFSYVALPLRSNTTPLTLASENTSVDIVKALLEKGARVNDLDGEGLTTLSHAVFNGNAETVAALLESGADVHAGENPLLLTVDNERWDEILPVAKLLLKAGADINKPSSEDGQTVLMRAVQEGNADMVRFFIAAGAHVADRDDQDRTAEIFAKRSGNKEIIELLQKAENKGGNS